MLWSGFAVANWKLINNDINDPWEGTCLTLHLLSVSVQRAEMSVISIKAITRIEIWSNRSAEKSWSLKEWRRKDSLHGSWPKHKGERLELGQEKSGLAQGRHCSPDIHWWVKECKWFKGAAISEMTKSCFAHLIQACNKLDQKVRK